MDHGINGGAFVLNGICVSDSSDSPQPALLAGEDYSG